MKFILKIIWSSFTNYEISKKYPSISSKYLSYQILSLSLKKFIHLQSLNKGINIFANITTLQIYNSLKNILGTLLVD